MRVLHVISSLSLADGGPPQSLVSFTRALSTAGVDVTIASTDHDGGKRWDVPRMLETRPELAEYEVRLFPQMKPRVRRYSPELGSWLRGKVKSFDLVQCHGLYLGHTWQSAAAASGCGVPFVVRPHGTLTRYHRRAKRRRKDVWDFLVERSLVLDRACALHFTSIREREDAISFGYRTPSFVVPVPVEVPQPIPPDRLTESVPDVAALSPADTTVLFLGRVTPKKRLGLLVRAVGAAQDRGMKVNLIVCGPVETASAVDVSLARAILRPDRLAITGAVSPGTRDALLEIADVVVLPSIEENFGNAVAEAMRSGVPVVVTKGVSLASDIESAGAGIVTTARIDSIADAIASIGQDPELSQKMASSGRAYASDVLSPRRVGASLRAEYERIIEHPASGLSRH